MFDSHIARLLEAAVSLVNTLTDGEACGRVHHAPRDGELASAVDSALPGTDGERRVVAPDQAVLLAGTARELRRVFEAMSAGQPDEGVAVVNALLVSSGARPQLDRAPGEPWQLHFHGAEDSLAVGWSAGCATGLAIVISSGLGDRLGVCQATQCDRVYLDTSRNGTRQFCSTACQNRTKTAAFRARRGGRP
ncbi:CGNR zinc finger domain-containing protein [Streptomyces palmae]|uniref:CGNR zinc finger domain-containing protein n=1 Tax=Streptomyces palmae TaxID=1701085 RepID=A0A4Z0G0X2_9ACTN|nr:CGNR zinc finger domain-containing protein [Streptomyces palmae]TGA87560.1 CGNR zinc finger domain-containing protein [Streptomyces palmae]